MYRKPEQSNLDGAVLLLIAIMESEPVKWKRARIAAQYGFHFKIYRVKRRNKTVLFYLKHGKVGWYARRKASANSE